jgi:peptide/nickel transport system ATP-binding protein
MVALHSLQISHQGKVLVDIHFKFQNSLALIGQSGSGKSLTLKALLGMLPQGMDSSMKIDTPFPLVAGKTVGFVPQNPFTALSPLSTIEKQFFAPKQRIEQLFVALGLEFALLKRFPPELSGGQLQRVVIAMALEFSPKLLLLDEPTTALDPQTKESIVKLLQKLQQQEGFAMLFVTHDIATVRDLCEDVCVLKEGRVVESAKMQEVFTSPKSPYTKQLIEANFKYRKFRE